MSNLEYNKEREKKYDSFIEELYKKNEDSIINYDKLNPSILNFHDKGILFSITATNKEEKIYLEVNKYFKLISNNIIK